MPRRSFLAGLGLAACSRRNRAGADEPAIAASLSLPPMPEAGTPPLARGKVGTQTWIFDGGGRAIVVVPAWVKSSERLPVLVALHGRGEALKGPELGVMGWPHDYALLRAIERVCTPPLTSDDFEGFVEARHLNDTNKALESRPFRGLVVVCPYLPDIDIRKPARVHDYGEYLWKSVMPRVQRELPVLTAPASTGIDGVSLGGAVALRVGLEWASLFGAVGTLQAAISEDQISELLQLVASARTQNPKVALRLLTSKEDYFRVAITKMSRALQARGIGHDFADVPGPHDYPFNRGPGAIEMLLWHDRMLTHD